MVRPGRSLALLCLLGLLACGCGGAGATTSGTGPTTVTAPPGYAPAKPTGSGADLHDSYAARCQKSLANPPHLHATGPGTVTVIKRRSPDTSHTVRQIWIYRPGGVPDSAQLPVLYALHGLPGNPSTLWRKFNTAKLLDQDFAQGMAPLVVVTLDGNGAKHPDTEWADSIDGSDRVESFLLDVAIPAVEGQNRRDPCHRAIDGFSMGGYGAANLAQRHPDVFGQAVSIAGYFHLSDPDGMFGDDPTIKAQNAPDRQVGRMNGLRVFLLDAGQENLKLIKGEAEDFAKQLTEAKIPVLLDFSPGRHNNEYAVAQEPAIATYLEAGWGPQVQLPP